MHTSDQQNSLNLHSMEHISHDETGPVTQLLRYPPDLWSMLIIMHKGRRVYIEMEASDLEASPSRKKEFSYFVKLGSAGHDADDHFDDIFTDWMIRSCEEEIGQLETRQIETLRDWYDPQTVSFRLCATEKGDLVIRSIDKRQVPVGAPLPPTGLSGDWLSWPTYLPGEVSVHHDYRLRSVHAAPCMVSVAGKGTCFYQRFDTSECMFQVAAFSVTKHTAIKDAGLEDLQVSGLHGVVCDSTRLFGLLLSYIPSQGTLDSRARLVTSLLRRRWAGQLVHTLSKLHEANIAWDEVSAANVLIDDEDNAWLVGFGWGFTRGCDAEKLAEAIEGDKQGLARILEFLYETEQGAASDQMTAH